MSSIFTKLINGELPCHKIAENDEFIAFLDITPLTEGHTLVVPKQEIDYIFDIVDDKLARMMIFAKAVALQVEKSIPCLRIGVGVIGLEVRHAHIHLIPLQKPTINFTAKKLSPTQEELAATAARIVNI